MAEYVNPDVLISDEELEAKLGDPSIRVIEVDEDTSLYGKGHIPGAIAWNWKTELHDPLRRDFIDQKQLAALLKKSGVGSDTTVVLYAGNNNWFSAYTYWLVRYLGFDNVKLLNGGRKKWELESRQLTSEVPAVAPATSAPTLGAVRPELRALRDEVLNAVKTGDRAWVDVRSPEEFRGDLLAPPHLPQEQAQVPGHIPGASNIPWSKAAAEDGTFRSADELKQLYADAGVGGDKPIIAYCRIGERSSHSWFVLTELLGYDNVKNYDGSWTEYGSLVGVPVER
ncbi:MAG: sulfurtransferase [Actinobacteria bacterium]|nr:MAG: sulfurtransferase [Actinomycetota bacterium]